MDPLLVVLQGKFAFDGKGIIIPLFVKLRLELQLKARAHLPSFIIKDDKEPDHDDSS
jgi:hypothetical protein